jgi:hypothetical protein
MAIAGGVFALIATLLLVWIIRSSTMSPAKMTVIGGIAGLLFGLCTNVATYFIFKAADKPADTVAIGKTDPEVLGGTPFTLSGTATVADGDELWIIVYRPSGGYEIASRTPIAVAADGTWIFSPISVGRSAAAGNSTSPDVGATFTVAAVAVDKSGGDNFRRQISTAANPIDIFVNDAGPIEVLARATSGIKVK